MELKDLVKEVLGEIQSVEESNKNSENELEKVKEIHDIFNEQKEPIEEVSESIQEEHTEQIKTVTNDESEFLNGLRDRLLVLFDGFNSPNNTKIEAKIDLTVNFLELVLAKIENRLESIDKTNKKG